MKLLYRFYFVLFFFPTSNERQLHLSYPHLHLYNGSLLFYAIGYVVKTCTYHIFSQKLYSRPSQAFLAHTLSSDWNTWLCLLTDPSLAFTSSSAYLLELRSNITSSSWRNCHCLAPDQIRPFCSISTVSPIPLVHRTEPGVYHRYSISLFL